MAEGIEIKVFDGFVILKDGKPILENLANTRKTKLFVAYLITNRDRAVSHQELFELLWSGEEYANPATALRTLLYRFRSMIENEGATDLSGAIISKKGTYQWNKNLDISIDSIDFATKAQIGMDITKPIEVRKTNLFEAIELYTGPILPDFCSEPWLISKSAFCRDLYVDVVEAYISILKSENQYAQIVEVCEKALKLAGASEIIELEESVAKLRIANLVAGKEDSAISYYNQVKELSDRLRDDTDKIQKELEDDTVEQKAFLCDYETFKEIYRYQRRIQSRSKATVFLGLINISGDFVNDAIATKETMNDVIDCCQRQLRCGDTICKKSDSQIALLFPAESYEDAMRVLERLKSASLERTDEDLVIVYRVRPLKNARE